MCTLPQYLCTYLHDWPHKLAKTHTNICGTDSFPVSISGSSGWRSVSGQFIHMAWISPLDTQSTQCLGLVSLVSQFLYTQDAGESNSHILQSSQLLARSPVSSQTTQVSTAAPTLGSQASVALTSWSSWILTSEHIPECTTSSLLSCWHRRYMAPMTSTPQFCLLTFRSPCTLMHVENKDLLRIIVKIRT